MEIINLTVSHQCLTCDRKSLVSDTRNVYECHFTFDDEWLGHTKFAVFKNNQSTLQVLLNEDKCLLPFQIIQNLGYLAIGVYGINDDKKYPTIYTAPVQILLGASTGTEPVPPTPSEWEQIIAELSNIENDIDDLQENKVDKEVGKGLSSNDFTDEEKAKLDNLNPEELGKVDDVLVNGTSVLGQDKKARVVVPTKTSDLQNDSDYVDSEYVETHGGKIDVIKKNGVVQPIVNKQVDISVPTKTSEITNDSNFQTSSQVESAITSKGYQTAQQVEDRIIAKGYATEEYVDSDINNLQSQIDSLVSKSDVVDVVGTYQELLAYDTSKLNNNDVVKVLDDSTHQNQRSYYRWVITTTGSWNYVGSESVGYTKAQVDEYLNDKVDKVEGYSLASDTQLAQIETNKNNISSLDTNKADKSTTYTKNEVDSAINNHHDSTKQDTITDLQDIREGAELGASAVQQEELDNYYTKEEVDEKIVVVDVELSSNNTAWGTVNEGGIIKKDTSYTAIATETDIGRFVRWENADGETVSTNATYVFVANDNVELTAIFEYSPVQIVSWADGTVEQLKNMLDAHYLGQIDIHDYWSVGDTRIVTIPEIQEYAVDGVVIVPHMDSQLIETVLMDTTCLGYTNVETNQAPEFIVGFKQCFKNAIRLHHNTDEYVPSNYDIFYWLELIFYNLFPLSPILKKMKYNIAYFENDLQTQPTLKEIESFLTIPVLKVYGFTNYAYRIENDIYQTWEYYLTPENREKNAGSHASNYHTISIINWSKKASLNYIDTSGNALYGYSINKDVGMTLAMCI